MGLKHIDFIIEFALVDTVTGEVLARYFGISGTQVTALARRGLVVKAGRRGFDVEQSVRAYSTHLRELAAAQGRPAQSGTGKRAGSAGGRAGYAAELKDAIRRGTLVDAEFVALE